MKILIVSDLHVHNDERVDKVRQLRTVVYDEKPDIVILNGDVHDPWVASWDDIGQTESYQLLDDLTKWPHVRTIYIDRNHDYKAPAWVLPSAQRCGQFQSGVWLFMHGYEFSLDWGLLGISLPLFWLSMRCPRLMIPLNRLAISTHSHPNGRAGTFREDWTPWVDTGHMRARMYAQKHNVNLCIGHFHCPSAFDGLICDDGDFEDSFTYVIIPNDNEPVAELRTL